MPLFWFEDHAAKAVPHRRWAFRLDSRLGDISVSGEVINVTTHKLGHASKEIISAMQPDIKTSSEQFRGPRWRPSLMVFTVYFETRKCENVTHVSTFALRLLKNIREEQVLSSSTQWQKLGNKQIQACCVISAAESQARVYLVTFKIIYYFKNTSERFHLTIWPSLWGKNRKCGVWTDLV